MKKNLMKCLLFISSYFPLYFFLLVLNFDQYNSYEKIKRIPIIIFLISMLICMIVSLISIVLIKVSKNGTKKILIENIERPDDTIISYIMTYIIPIVTVNNISKYEIIVNILLFILIGYLYIRLNLLYLNPLWSMFGYIPYRINNDTILITNYKMSELKNKQKNGQLIKGFFMVNDIFIAQREK
ncbi:MAG: hypothetical protein KHW50_00490 [Clostridium sp.]|nr:hypothetical protein [Clostridium sp.]